MESWRLNCKFSITWLNTSCAICETWRLLKIFCLVHYRNSIHYTCGNKYFYYSFQSTYFPFVLNYLSSPSSVLLKLWCVSDFPGRLIKTQIYGPHYQSFWFCRSQLGPDNLYFLFLTSSQVILMLLVPEWHFRTSELGFG